MKSSNTEGNLGFRSLFPYFTLLVPLWFPMLGAFLCGIIYGISSGFGLPYMVDQIFPKIFSGDNVKAPELSFYQLAFYVAWLPAVFLIRGLSGYFNSYLINYCGIKVLEKIRLLVFTKLQKLPLAFFHKNKEGDLLSRITNDTTQLQESLLRISNDLIKQPITFVGAISYLVWKAMESEGMAFVLLCLLVIPVCVFPIRKLGEILMDKALGMQRRIGDMTSVLSENLSASREIRAFNLEEKEEARFRNSSREFFKARMKVIKYSNMLTPIIEIITASGVAIAIFQASQQSVRLDAVIPVIMALFFSYEPIKKLGAIQNQLKQGLASLNRLEEVLSADESIKEAQQPVPPSELKGELQFRRVSFSYELDKPEKEHAPTLRSIDFTIDSGEIVALVGPSGAGKTTLTGLLPRFHDPIGGSILLDGVDLRNMPLKDLREAIALVPQKPFLFDLSVRQNVELGRSIYTSISVEEALELSHANEFVDELPSKLDERLGEDGVRLSGGQLQRLALARAFFRNSPVLVLDEATSALDSENEHKIHEAMTRLTKGKTTLLIAHRFSSIRLANRIIVIDKGLVVADGSHEKVYTECDLYRKLYDQQQDSVGKSVKSA
ncbi:MAG: ABC transporter ATP-binding protein [Verrucomicrobiota bacterium]|nr:ABC transporter ATP-binding protein [Verrucomicrobiota bacterium]